MYIKCSSRAGAFFTTRYDIFKWLSIVISMHKQWNEKATPKPNWRFRTYLAGYSDIRVTSGY